ncbi:MAG: geranylgeranyl reductase family protein [Bacteroidetes bacterium]|nr:geranylgeranyl reductase family protein [Bacteroidota bacterium]
MSSAKILIVGAGPAGLSTSLFLSKAKIPHTVIDKAIFPRDKICGDALSGKVVHILNKYDKSLVEEIASDKNYIGSYGVSFFAPNGKRLDVPFSTNPSKLKQAPGFIATREVFDNFLFQKAHSPFADVRQNTSILNLRRSENQILVSYQTDNSIREELFDLVIGAEGDRSITAKALAPFEKNNDHYCAGLRVYYEGIENCHAENFIELHFIKDILPGYFWIFPMSGNRMNVGIGMLSSEVSARKVNLKKELEQIITTHPVISPRFKNAKAVTDVQGWGLPLGSAKRIISGDNFLLVGDAASLIDPFTGEGIGNALASGRLAAEVIEGAVKTNRFDAAFLSEYDKKIEASLGSEIRLSHTIQKLAKKEWLFNLVVNKAIKNTTLRETITCMFEDLDIRERLRKPSFYFKLLFNR